MRDAVLVGQIPRIADIVGGVLTGDAFDQALILGRDAVPDLLVHVHLEHGGIEAPGRHGGVLHQLSELEVLDPLICQEDAVDNALGEHVMHLGDGREDGCRPHALGERRDVVTADPELQPHQVAHGLHRTL